MDFGIFTMFNTREGFTQSQTFKEWFDVVQVAEDIGIDTFWLGESHFRPQRAVLASPLVGASVVAARTKRIRVGLAVQVLPLANPLRVAEEAAIVDHVSEGRLIFGVGRSSFIESYLGYNVDYAESRAIFLESLEIIQRAWRETSFSYKGKYYQFHDVDVVPKPYQQPHPPIRVAVESRDTFALIGQLGFPIFMRYQMSVPELQVLLKQYQEERHAAGFPGPNDVILQLACYVAQTADKARTEPEASTMRQRRLARETLHRTGDQEAFERLSRLANVTYDQVLNRVAYGTPEAVVERLQEFKEAFGLTGVSLDMNPGGQIPYDRVVNSIRLLAEQVMPHFKWPWGERPERVAVVASSSWSHSFLAHKFQCCAIDLDTDRHYLELLRRGAGSQLAALTPEEIQASGDHELLNWIIALGIIGDTPAEIVDVRESHTQLAFRVAAIWEEVGV